MIARFLLVFLIGSAWAVKPASPDKFTKIERLIAQAKVIEDGINLEKIRIIKAEGPIPGPDFKDRMDKELKPERDKRDALMQKAMMTALVAYGLVAEDSAGNPIMPSGTIQDPVLKQYGFEGPVTWKVTYQDPPPAKRLVAPGFGVGRGRKGDLTVGVDHDEYRKYDGSTVGDGYTVLWANPIDPKTKKLLTPPALARLLHHELKHFEIKTTSRRGGPLGPNREEVEVYKADLAELGNFGFLPAEEKSQQASLTASRDQYQRQVYKDDTSVKFQSFSARVGGFIWGGHDINDAALESSIPGLYISAATLNEIRARAEQLDERIVSGQEERRWESVDDAREPVEDVEASGSSNSGESGPGGPACATAPRGGIPTPCIAPSYSRIPVTAAGGSQAIPARLPEPAVAASLPRDRWADLKNLAVRGCADLGSVTQAEIDGIWPSLRGLPFSESRASEMGLSGCSMNLFQRLLWMAADGNPVRMTVEVFSMAAGASQPIQPSSDFGQEDPSSRPATPTVPTCRHHPWCQEWKP